MSRLHHMQALWEFIRDPFGTKRIKALREELLRITSAKPSYSPETLYMETLATEFVKSLPNLSETHPDVRAKQRIKTGFEMARDWITELEKGVHA